MYVTLNEIFVLCWCLSNLSDYVTASNADAEPDHQLESTDETSQVMIIPNLSIVYMWTQVCEC